MGAAGERVLFMVGRVVAGVGVGVVTSVTPVYQSEVSSAGQRGWLVCCQLSTMLVGLMLAYWINYGMYFSRWGYSMAVSFTVSMCFFCLYTCAYAVSTGYAALADETWGGGEGCAGFGEAEREGGG